MSSHAEARPKAGAAGMEELVVPLAGIYGSGANVWLLATPWFMWEWIRWEVSRNSAAS